MPSVTQLRSPHLKELGNQAREFEKLTERPEWHTLRAVFEQRKQSYLRKLANDLIAGGDKADPLNQREIDYRRGWLRGAQAILDAPEQVIAEFQKALEKEGNDRSAS